MFGKITLVEEGVYLPWDSLYVDFRHLLEIIPPAPSPPIVIQLHGDGYFYWDLKPGEYTIQNVIPYKADYRFLRTEMIRAKFKVPAGAESIYIGDLVVRKNKRHYSWDINNAYQKDVAVLKAHFPLYKGHPVAHLMEEVKIGNYDRIEPICSHEWGIDCGSDKTEEKANYFLSGVFAENPVPRFKGVGALFRRYDLKPNFSWQASEQTDISYDFVVFENARYFLPASGYAAASVPGAMVLYKEGLKTPTYQVVNELEPDSKYFWSVRLRRNNTVSTWTRFNYSIRHKPAMVAGYNEMFSFYTKPKEEK